MGSPRLVAVLASAAALGGCGSEPLQPEVSGSHFAAVVEGEFDHEYGGTGFFSTYAPPAGSPHPGVFTIFSWEPDPKRRQVHSFHLARAGETLPPPGVYALGPQQLIDPSVDSFSASFFRSTPARQEGYIAISGRLEITHATADRVEGSFEMVGVQNCVSNGGVSVCSFSPEMAEDPTLPRVEVSGSFSARPSPARRIGG